jgi:hypothetical protein
MAFSDKIARWTGSLSGISGGSISSALSQGVNYTLGMAKTMNPSLMMMFANTFKVEDSMTHSSGPVTSLTITNAGDNYTGGPTTVSISGGGGTGATATVLEHPALYTIIGWTITNGGSGYTSAPTVSIESDFGSGATATATITTNTNVPVFNLRNRHIFDVVKITRGSYMAQPVPVEQQFAVEDSKSIYYSQASSPTYYIDSKADLLMLPDTSSTEKGNIFAVIGGEGKDINDTNETIMDKAYTLFGVTYATSETFPKIWKELVVLHASEVLLIEKLSDFSDTLPSDLDDTTVFDKIADVELSVSPTKDIPADFSHSTSLPSFTTVAFPSSDVQDALDKARYLFDKAASIGDDDGTGNVLSVQKWLEDEDEDMVTATLNGISAELNRASAIVQEHTSQIGSLTQDFNNQMTKYTTEINKEAQRIGLDISEYNAELQGLVGIKNQEMQEYTTNLSKMMGSYTTLIQKINTDYQWVQGQLGAVASKKQ